MDVDIDLCRRKGKMEDCNRVASDHQPGLVTALDGGNEWLSRNWASIDENMNVVTFAAGHLGR